MAKLVFVTGGSTTGKSQYINRDRGHDSLVIEEAAYSSVHLSTIDDTLRLGRDVYVSWILPEGAEIQIVTEDMR